MSDEERGRRRDRSGDRGGAFRSFRRFLTWVGGLTLLALVLGAVFSLLTQGAPGVPDRTVLELDLERNYPEHMPREILSRQVVGEGPTVLDLVEALERAASDERVVGLVARVGNSGMGLARVQELRDAVLRFRESGKPAVAFAETFGEVGPGNVSYYLATAFDEIRLQPSGDVGLTGLRSETMFLAEALDEVGVRIEGDRRHEYKNAFNMFVDTAYTEPHREATAAVIRSQFGQMLEGIAKGRGLAPDSVRALFEHGPFLGGEAVESGLVDGLSYRDEVYDDLFGRFEGEFELLYAGRYRERAGSPHDGGTTVGLVYGTGPVQRGESEFSFQSLGSTMGSESVTAALRAATEDEEVEAILFRVSSPGGSYVASDAIWRVVSQAREAGKPVVVSMGDVAGSGGYFVAMGADAIVAHPATVTGSIGVLNFKPVMTELWEKLGIDWDAVQTGERADMWSQLARFDDRDWARFQAWLDRVYEDFTAKAAEGRGLPVDSLRKLARGRIWSGEDAERHGLVDALGGYPTALAEVRDALELDVDAPLRLKRFPRPVPLWKRFLEEPPSNSEERVSTLLLRRLGEVAGPAAAAAREAGLLPPAGVLSVPRVPRPR